MDSYGSKICEFKLTTPGGVLYDSEELDFNFKLNLVTVHMPSIIHIYILLNW